MIFNFEKRKVPLSEKSQDAYRDLEGHLHILSDTEKKKLEPALRKMLEAMKDDIPSERHDRAGTIPQKFLTMYPGNLELLEAAGKLFQTAYNSPLVMNAFAAKKYS